MDIPKEKCPECEGEGWTSEHDAGCYAHNEDGECLGYCPVQAQCESCLGTGDLALQPKE